MTIAALLVNELLVEVKFIAFYFYFFVGVFKFAGHMNSLDQCMIIVTISAMMKFCKMCSTCREVFLNVYFPV